MITIYNNHGDKIIDVQDLEGSYCDRSIMGGSTLQLVIRSAKVLDIPLGSYVEYQGHRYTLMYPEHIKKNHTKDFEYTILFHGEEELLSQCIIKDISGGIPYRVKFALTAKPIDYIRCIVGSLNEHYGGGWSVGEVIDATEQTLAFSHEYCLGALSRVAEVFNTEYNIESKRISLGKVSIMEDNPLPMSYGAGNGFRSGTGRHNDGSKSAIGKLYVQGGTRNIDYSTYGAQTLILPKSDILRFNSRTYHTDAHGMYITCDVSTGTAEDSFDGSSIYPMREGTITKVIQEKDGYDFTDTSIPDNLNFNDYRIKGEKAVVVFQTGALAGREFSLVQTKDKLTGYIHAERRFKLISEEQDGFTMPGGNFVPKAGDKYAVFNISLPTEYLSNASRRLFEEAVRYFDSVINPPYIFSGEVDPIWAKKEWLRIGGYMLPGAHILFTDPQYHPNGSVIRVTGVRTPLDHPYAPQLTLSNAPSSPGIGNTLSKLEAEPVLFEHQTKMMQRQQRQDYRQALEALDMVEKAVSNLEGFTERIKPSVIETMGLLIGSEASQFGFVKAVGSLEVETPAINYDSTTKRLTITKGVIRHQSIGITTLKNNRKPSEYRYWSLPAYSSPALTEEVKSYYIYAKVNRTTQEGNYLLSEDPIKMEEAPEFYHLLVGTLSSVIDGDRAYNRLYGFTKIGPGNIVVDTISSANGNMSINLETGEIFSDKITFRRPSSSQNTNLLNELDEQDKKRTEAITAEKSAREQATSTLAQQLKALEGKTATEAQLNELMATINSSIKLLQKQVDREVSNYFYPGYPSPNVKPEIEWTTNQEKARHINDTFTSLDKEGEYVGMSWRYTTKFTWEIIPDVLVLKALKLAADAQASADGKSTTYYHKPNGYQEGDSWLLQEDTEIAGKLYKSGTIIYAHATRESGFVQADWQTNAYITQAEIDNIKIGGRNYWFGSRNGFAERVVNKYGTNKWENSISTKNLREGEVYTLSTFVKDIPSDKSIYLRIDFYRKDGSYSSLYKENEKAITSDGVVSHTFVMKNTDEFIELAYRLCDENFTESFVVENGYEMFEKGNKVTDWTPAPEDLIAQITEVKGEVGSVTASVTNLRNEVNTIFADGIVDKAEAKAIEKYLNVVKADKVALEATYNKLFTNELLKGDAKSTLTNAKVTYFGAVENLLQSIAVR